MNAQRFIIYFTDITFIVLDYLERDWMCTVLLPETGRKDDDKYCTFQDVDSDAKTTLALNYSMEKNSLVLSLFAQYWMVNKTNEDITYRIDDSHVYPHPKNLSLSKPFLLCKS